MPDIYITNQNAEYDYDDADRYLDGGQMIFMTRGYVKVKGNEEKLVQQFAKYFASAKEADYLLLSGPSVLCALATVAWCRLFDGATLLYNLHEKRDGKIVQTYQPAWVAPETT